MPRLNVDFSKTEKRDALPNDTYDCFVDEIEGPENGASSTYLRWVFEVSDGEFAGRKLYQNTPVDGKGAGIFARTWEAATGEEIDVEAAKTTGLDIDTDDAIGAKVKVTTKQKEYPEGSGEYQSEVRRVSKR